MMLWEGSPAGLEPSCQRITGYIPGLLQPRKLHSQVLNPFNSDCLAWFSSLAFSTDCSSKNSSFPFMVMH